MISIPDNIKALLNSDSVRKNFRVHFPNGERADITNENIVSESLSFEESICSQSSLKFGLCESPYIEFETYGVGKIKGATIECSIEISNDEEVTSATTQYTGNHTIYVGLNIPDGAMFSIHFTENMARALNKVVLHTSDGSGEHTLELSEDKSVASIEWRESYNTETIYGDSNSITVYFSSSFESANQSYYYTYVTETIYSIPLGTFVVDSCKKQADMTHRKIVAYAQTADYSLTRFNRFTNLLNNAFYWNTSNFVVSINGLVKLLNLSDGDLSESQHNTYTKTITYYNNIKITQTYKIYSFPNRGNFLYAKYKYDKQFVERTKDAIDTYIKPNISSFVWFDFVNYMEHGLRCSTSSNIYVEKNNTYSTEYVYDDYLLAMPFIKYGEFTSYPTYDYYSFMGSGSIGSSGAGFCGITTRVEIYDKATDELLFDSGDYSTDNKIISYNSETFLTNSISSFYLKPKTSTKSVKLYDGTNSTTKTLYLYDFSEIFQKDMRTITESFCELQGKFGKTNRDGSFELFSLKDKFTALYPSETLYSSETLYPSDNVGLDVMKSNYKTFWYDDDETLPYGSVSCTYNNGTDNVYIKVYATGYDDDSSLESYQNYDVSNNEIIKTNTYTETQITAILNTIAENIRGISFMPSEISMVGRPDLESGDVLTVVTTEGWIKTLVLRRTLTGIQALSDEITSD